MLSQKSFPDARASPLAAQKKRSEQCLTPFQEAGKQEELETKIPVEIATKLPVKYQSARAGEELSEL